MTVSALRVRFLAEAPANAAVFARFSDPRSMVAVGESTDAASLALPSTTTTDSVEIITATAVKLPAAKLQEWLGDTDRIRVKTELCTVYFRPGLVVFHAQADVSQPLIAAVVEFAFYESQLRKLESAIKPAESTADADVSLAYEMTGKTRHQWDRLYRTMEQLYRLRLHFARLEPHMQHAPETLPVEARQVFRRLLSKARIADRLEAASNRLETCEDLYEGAIDRITDYKAYRKGNFLEIAIVILLALEVALMWMQWHGAR